MKESKESESKESKDKYNPKAQVRRPPLWKTALKPWPWLEITTLSTLCVIAYIGWVLISPLFEPSSLPQAMSPTKVAGWISGFFFISFAIGFIGTLCGIGGGVMWSPLCLAFTPLNSVVVRAQGLIVAMFNGLVACGPTFRSGLAPLRLVLFTLITNGAGAFVGAVGAIFVAARFGVTGEALVRLTLGLIVWLFCAYFLFGGKKVEWPEVTKVDRFTRFFRLPVPYYEPSLDKVMNYELKRGHLNAFVVFLVGLTGGFFGMGGGWALIPALNMIMGCPLKIAAGVSMGALGFSSCISVWPYLLKGALIPIFAAPLLVGQVFGGVLGAFVLVRVRAFFVRFILIGVLLFTGFGLVTKGMEMLNIIKIPDLIRIGFMGLCVLFTLYLVQRHLKGKE